MERAGSYGILGLAELLDLPRLVGHPQAAKLRLTTRLPHRPGVYWFTDAAGHVLYVGKATDIQTRVRSYFTGDRRPKVGRLLRQLYTIQHRVCPGLFTATVIEGRMIRAWNPPYNRQGRARRARSVPVLGRAEGRSVVGSTPAAQRRPRRSHIASRIDVSGDPYTLLTPLMAEVATHAAAQRYEQAGAVRDEATRLRNTIIRHRRTEAVRGAGRLVLEICREGTVELHDGLFVEGGVLIPESIVDDPNRFGVEERLPDAGPFGHRPVNNADADADAAEADQDRTVAAQWIHVNAESIRVVHSEHPLCWPAVRIPELTDLVAPRCDPDSG